MDGKRLVELRKSARLTQEQLGAVLGLNKHSVSCYERNRNEPSDDVKIKIAKYFNVSVDYLVGITNNPKPGDETQNYIRIPDQLPKEAIAELKEYLSFLMHKYDR